MPKRKKPQISGDESHLLKSKKTSRIGNTDRKPENSGMRKYFNLEDSEIATVSKQDGEECSQADISSVEERTDGHTKEPIQPGKAPVSFPFSQNSLMKFVPVFVQAKKSLIQKTERKEKTAKNSNTKQIMFAEPNHQKAENIQFDEPLVAVIQEDEELEDQKQNICLIPEMDSVGDGRIQLCQEQDSQIPLKSPDGSHYLAAIAFNNTPEEMGSITSVQERTNKHHLSEGMTKILNDKNPESKNLESGSLVELEMNGVSVCGNLTMGSHSQKEAAPISSNDSTVYFNRPLPGKRATNESDITWTTYGLIGSLHNDDFPKEWEKREESSLAFTLSDSNLGKQSSGKQNPWDSATEKGCPNNVPQYNRMNQNANLSHDSQGSRTSRQECQSFSWPTAADSKVITDICTSTGKGQVMKTSQLISGSTEVPSFSNGNDSIKLLLEGNPYTEKSGTDREEAGYEDEQYEGIRVVSDHSASTTCSSEDLVHKTEHKDALVLALEEENLYADVEQKQVTTSKDPKEGSQLPGTRVRSLWLMDLVDDKDLGLGIRERSEQKLYLKESHLSASTAHLFLEKEIIAAPAKETEANGDSRKSAKKTDLPESGYTSRDQTDWGESLALELDFLPDSQIRDALDDPNFGFPSEQLSPVENTLVPSLPGKNLHPDEDQVSSEAPVALKSTSSHNKPQPRDETVESICDPSREDATAIVCGLTVELSNLKDLESFRRLKQRKGKTAGKQPPHRFPYPLKGGTKYGSQAVKKWKEK